MATYYFSTAEDGNVVEGTQIDLESLGAVRDMAVRYLSDLVRDQGARLFDEQVAMNVTDGDGLLLFTIDIVAIASPAAR